MRPPSTSSSNAVNTTPPNTKQLLPGEQVSFVMPYDPQSVNVKNVSDSVDGNVTYVWIYPDTTSVTPVQSPIASEADITIRPPPIDGNNLTAKTIVIYNTGQAVLVCHLRGN